ncbi:MAG: thiamine pyrophosphate-dependent enzyme, partial [Bacteroidia bacterium]|nr:thiamine pyrophosphate-dependent enzyme [Bacteroidia bacterium]
PGSYSNIKMGKSVEDNPFYILKSLHTSLMNEVYDNHLRKHWVKKILKTTISKEIDIPVSKIGQIEPGRLIQILQEEMPKESILCVDSGNVRIFPGLYWKAKTAESLFTAAKMAPLGWAIASGIGCKFARNEPVVVFTGDGSMQMHGIELKTAVKHHLPMLVIISNNNAFGSVYTRFSKISDEAAKMTSITEIDWNLFSKSFGAEVFDVTTEENFIICIRNFLTNQKLTILNVRTPVKPYIHDLSLIKPAFN